MQTTWQGHRLRVTGDWVGRYLFLAPRYELWLDEERLDWGGGPRTRPRLEAIVEIETEAPDGPLERHHIEAHVLSVAGIRPMCELLVDGQVVHADRVRVENLLNPLLVLFILITTSWMLYVGPDVLRAYLGR